MTSLRMRIINCIPPWLHRHLLRLAQRARMGWRQCHYRPSAGCAVIVQNEHGHVLLVRHSYVDPDTWMLPAGRMKRREAPLAAAQREVNEEINCELSNMSLLEFEDTEFWGRRHTTFIVGGLSRGAPEADLREIEEAAFFSLSSLPASTSKPTVARLERWRLRNSIPFPVPAFVRVDYVRERVGQQAEILT